MDETKAERIRGAIAQMDPDVAAHWTQHDTPQVSQIVRFAGMAVSKAEIEEVAPGLTRETMRQRLAAELGAVLDAAPAVVAPPEPEPVAVPEVVAEITFQERMRTLDGVNAAIATLRESVAAQTKIRNAAVTEIERMTALLNIAERQRQQFTAHDPAVAQEAIMAPLRARRKAEIEQDTRLREFLAPGVTKKSLMAALDPRSPLQKALSNRPRRMTGSAGAARAAGTA